MSLMSSASNSSDSSACARQRQSQMLTIPVNEKVQQQHKLVLDRGIQDPDGNTALHRVKAKKLIEGMKPVTLEEIGSTTWIKKLNALVVIVNLRSVEGLMQDTEILEHFVKKGKVTLVIHDLVTTAVWRDKILPELERLGENTDTTKAAASFSGSTVSAVHAQSFNGSLVVLALLKDPQVGVALLPQSDWFDLIDYAIGELRYFIANKPNSDLSLDDGHEFDNAKGVMTRKSCYHLLISHTLRAAVILCSVLAEGVIDKVPPTVLSKLIHPDSMLIPTLVDLIRSQPWCYAKRNNYGDFKFTPEHKPGRNRRGKSPLPPLQATVWSLLHRIFILDADHFPPMALRLAREFCAAELLLLRTSVRQRRLRKAMPELVELQKFLDQIGTPKAPPDTPEGDSAFAVSPSPYFSSILAELEQKKDAIVRIHSAMGTFEAESEAKMVEKVRRDIYCLFPRYDLNKPCFYCGGTEAGQLCSRCKYAHYCGKKCQSKDWGKHKLNCKEKQLRS